MEAKYASAAGRGRQNFQGASDESKSILCLRTHTPGLPVLECKLLTHTRASIIEQHNLVPTKGQCAAGKASHWSRVTDIRGRDFHLRTQGLGEGDDPPAYAFLVEYGELYQVTFIPTDEIGPTCISDVV